MERSKTKTKAMLEAVKFDAHGLVPAVVQNEDTQEVLMVAYMNEEAFLKTLETGYTHFYSRSRKKLWKKGESSGHTQEVSEIRIDCDGDCLLVLAKQNVAACHTGYLSCFYRKRDSDNETWVEQGSRVFDPDRKSVV